VVDVELETAEREKALAELEQMSHDLLANPLIESYEIELQEET
jgi:phosphoribosylformylglycinamidine (FGAM) synthase PurS component